MMSHNDEGTTMNDTLPADLETLPEASAPGRYPHGARLAELRRSDVVMRVSCKNSALTLQVIDYRDKTSSMISGWRPFREAHWPAPVFVVSGRFDEDSEIALEWLEQHAAHIVQREREARR
jgi:hypothetical protein